MPERLSRPAENVISATSLGIPGWGSLATRIYPAVRYTRPDGLRRVATGVARHTGRMAQSNAVDGTVRTLSYLRCHYTGCDT